MKFRDFSKNLSDEIENLFATMGDSNLPEQTQRLDQTICIEEMLERVKNLEVDTNPEQDSSKDRQR